MSLTSPIASIFPGALPGEAAGKAGSGGTFGVFAALLATLDTGQTTGVTTAGTINAGLFAQLSLSEGELAGAGGEPRPDLAALLGGDVEVSVASGGIAASKGATGEGSPAADADLLLQAAGTTETAVTSGAATAAAASMQTAATAQPGVQPSVVNPVLDKAASKPAAEAAGDALVQGNRPPSVTSPVLPTATPAPAVPAADAAAQAQPLTPADPLKTLHEAAATPSQGNSAPDGEQGAEPAPAGSDDRRSAPAPSNRPVLVHVAPQPLTAQAIVTVQESPSADTIPLGATGGAAQTVQLKAVSAPPPPTPGANPVPLNGIAVHIAQQAQTGARRFDIRLDPPELGRIEVRLEVSREGHVHTHLVVERSETLDLLQRDARQLERALQDAGLDTSQGGMKFSLKEHGAEQQGARDDGLGKSSGTGEEAAPEPEDLVWQGRAYTATGGLDIRI